MKRKSNGGNIEIIIFVIFSIIGIGMFIGGVCFLIYSMNFSKIAKETTATVTEITRTRDHDGDVHHEVYVDYEVEGESYTHVHLNYYSSSMYKGGKINILYDPENPGRISSKGGNTFMCAVLMGMGVVFGAVGIIPMLVSMKKNRKQKRLRQNGRVLHANVVSMDINRSYTVNGRHPYYLICEYRDEYSGKTYRFKSGNIWKEVVLNSLDDQYIDVYVDPQDFSQYAVDVDGFIQKSQANIIDYT